MTQQICKNCGVHFKGSFCSSCGQKFNVSAFTFRHIFEEAFHAFTHADKGFLIMLKKLLLNPGKVAFEYIVEGRRKKYFNPFTFFVLVTAIAAFAESKELALKEAIFNINNEYGAAFNIYSKVLLLLTVPAVALVAWLAHFNKPRLRYSEYTVYAMMLLSVKGITDIIIKSINYLLTYFFKQYNGLEDHILYLLLMIIYIAYADIVFHKSMNRGSWWQSILTGILFNIILLLIVLLIIWAVFNRFSGIGHFSWYGIRFS